jgi:hypothetical protein
MFEKWFQEQLLPKLPPNFVIVIDNVVYHSPLLMENPTVERKKSLHLWKRKILTCERKERKLNF